VGAISRLRPLRGTTNLEAHGIQANRISARDLCALFEGLAGCWRLEREIPGIAQFSGEAVFAPTSAAESLAYVESGVLAMTSGHCAPAERRLLYRRMGGRLAIKDDDVWRRGALLHLLAFARPSEGATWIARHVHRCGDDAYGLEFRIVAPDCLRDRLPRGGAAQELPDIDVLPTAALTAAGRGSLRQHIDR
jgi:Family of unknown function (DUF6314)